MSRFIDADALVKGLYDIYIKTGNEGVQVLMRCLQGFPTVDAVQVVRCKDCKFWNRANTVTDIGFPDLARCLNGRKYYPDEFWYCADGERKD